MKLKFKHQQFQADAALAVCDVFAGQPYANSQYMIDPGAGQGQFAQVSFVEGFSNGRVQLTDSQVLENLQKVQKSNQILPSPDLEGRYNLTIEMETGVGKTYTYIKTMYELNKRYGWLKFIVVVPSIAIREGVKKSFEVLEDHFVEEYGKKIRYFVYNSSRLNEIDRFASDAEINVMIVNSQAFNATGKDARRIDMKLDEFRSRKPIDVLAATNPILVIDEPQSVEGKKTKESLKKFKPLLTLRYSATHRKDSIYNMVYRLDAIDAYNKKLVKKIAVKGITEVGSTGTNGYVYLEGINLSSKAPTATIWLEQKLKGGLKEKRAIVDEGTNLYDLSGELDEYKDGYTVKRIDGLTNTIEFLNGKRLAAGDMIGRVNEEQLRRIQIRETIQTHLWRERQLFKKGIKCLTLFFIDEVAKYRLYDDAGQTNGIYAQIFEEEYQDAVANFQREFEDEDYDAYLKSIGASATHAGYFSVDKKNRMVDGKTNREGDSDDVDAYDLIMKDKERLLDLDPQRSPVRFIFSHSALREGWDNPNVFQICTLKQSASNVRKRQEVGRGLRLCVNQEGERQDEGAIGGDVHNVNVLTIVASESYDSFAKSLQSELAEAVAFRPKLVDVNLFVGKTLENEKGEKLVVSEDIAMEIVVNMRMNGYLDKAKTLTEKYREARKAGEVEVAEEVKEFAPAVVKILDSVFDDTACKPENTRKNNVEAKVKKDKLASKEFQELWKRINRKSFYLVDFNSEELVNQAISKLDCDLSVTASYFKIETGAMSSIKSKEALEAGEAFDRKKVGPTEDVKQVANAGVKYDLVGRVVAETGLTRKTVVDILSRMSPGKFELFRYNPEEFIAKASRLINEAKGAVIVQHIEYNLLEEKYDTNIFVDSNLRGQLNVNAKKTLEGPHLYDHLVYDSKIEENFSNDLDANEASVAVYVKLPNSFFINTPVGRYNPDWAIAFKEGAVKHVYFVAETKGSNSSLQLKGIETAKIECARKHFDKLSSSAIKYGVVDSYEQLLTLVKN